MTSKTSYLIIGAGNFGVATALSLIGRPTTKQVTLVDSTPFPNPKAASHDINKIVRDDYPDPTYSALMIKGMQFWRTSSLYSPFYHQSGAMRADSSDFSARCLETYKKLGVKTDATWIPVEEAREKWSGVFATSAFSDLEKCFWNPQVGWAEAEQALRKVTETAIKQGVEYRATGVSKLLFVSSGACIGALLADGSEVKADNILVAAGAGTPLLLYNSDPARKQLHAGERAVATGAVSFYGRWDEARREKFKDVPVIKISVGGIKGDLKLSETFNLF
jgi:sarcosine oxidase/L-pipecolate oxidase